MNKVAFIVLLVTVAALSLTGVLANDKREAYNVISPDSPTPEVANDDSKQEGPNSEKIQSIAFNSREVRLVGPDQKEVEMKDDVTTKLVIALENLQKEATEVWGQVNEKLDKGWTDLKGAVQNALKPKKEN